MLCSDHVVLVSMEKRIVDRGHKCRCALGTLQITRGLHINGFWTAVVGSLAVLFLSSVYRYVSNGLLGVLG